MIVTWPAFILFSLTRLLMIHCQHMDIRACPRLKSYPTRNDNISDLRPGDIKLIMAMGDSLTAAFGANSSRFMLPSDWKDYPGLSFATGANMPSLANFFRYYQADPVQPLPGSSFGSRPVRLCIPSVCPPNNKFYLPAVDGLNAAITGGTSEHLKKQVTYLIDQINRRQDIDMENDWKMLSLLIGENDACKANCLARNNFTSDLLEDIGNFEINLIRAIEMIRLNIPRTIIYLHFLFDASEMPDYAERYKQRCAPSQWIRDVLCPCLRMGRKFVMHRINLYNQIIGRVLLLYSYPRNNNFAVLRSPVLLETHLFDMPIKITSLFDCAHPSVIGQQQMAMSIW